MQTPPPLRIFLVENHVETLKYMRLYLETLGHQVEVADSMATALERIPCARVDLLISDIGLSDGDGWELLRRLNAQRSVFAVAMSGYGLNADRAKSLAAGYRHHLLKPFMPDELEPILAQAAAFRDAPKP